MFRSYFSAALRNLVRNKFYAGLNITGLALGFTVALLIALFVRDEYSYDRWLPNAANIYLLTAKLQLPNQAPLTDDITPEELKAPLLLDYPQIADATRLAFGPHGLRHGEIETADDPMYWADANFFKIIGLKALYGNLDTALAEPNTVVLTRRMAQKYFGKDNPIGENLEVDRKATLKVTAILADLPSNTQFNTEIVGSALTAGMSSIAFKDARPPPADSWGVGSFTYFLLKSGAHIDDIVKSLPEFMAKHKGGATNFTGKAPLGVLPLTDVHFQQNVRGGFFFTLNPNGNPDTIAAIAAVGALILFIAAINFVNLTTARASRRALEVGMRKTVGADPEHLVLQFIGESLIYAAFAMVLAMAVTALVLPAFNAYLDRTIRFDFWADPGLLGGILAAVLAIGIAAGAYPAFVLSRFRPRVVLKSGTVQSAASNLLRSALVVIQFAVLIGLILATVVIYRQSQYALSRGTHLDTERVYVVTRGCAQSTLDAVRGLPGVEAAACSQGQILNRGKNGASVNFKDGTNMVVDIAPVDFGLFELYGIKPVAGRLFSQGRPGEQQPAPLPPEPGGERPPQPKFIWPVVVNEALALKISPGAPEKAVGQYVAPQFGQGGESEVIGVVPDFALDTHQAVPPTMYWLVPERSETFTEDFLFLSVKLRPGDQQATLKALGEVWKARVPDRPLSIFSLAQALATINADIVRQAQIFAALAVIAVFIAALGLFGLSAFTAERRTKEIGVRKALGADRAPIVGLLMWQFTKPVLWANVIAWPVSAYFIGQWLDRFPYHIPLEPWTFLAAGAVALAVAWITISGFSYRVAGAKPSVALRYE